MEKEILEKKLQAMEKEILEKKLQAYEDLQNAILMAKQEIKEWRKFLRECENKLI